MFAAIGAVVAIPLAMSVASVDPKFLIVAVVIIAIALLVSQSGSWPAW